MQEVMMGHDRAAASIVALKSSGITDLKQLVGKTIGAAANDSTFKLFPILARKNGFDPTSVKVQNIEPSLRETLLARRSVDAIPAQVFNAVLELKAKGVRPEDVSYFMYNTSGLDIYGNGVAVARDFMKNNPEAVRGYKRATIKGARDMVRNPEAAVQAAVKFEPLLNPDIERDRLKLALECCILTPNVKANGYGAIDVARLKLAIDEITEGYGLPRKPTVEEMYNPTFLPPQQDRMLQ
jgi:NitT/TauT family transport system substrate-binding protein